MQVTPQVSLKMVSAASHTESFQSDLWRGVNPLVISLHNLVPFFPSLSFFDYLHTEDLKVVKNQNLESLSSIIEALCAGVLGALEHEAPLRNTHVEPP